MPDATLQLTRILELEQKAGFTNHAVVSGLDSYLRRLLTRNEVPSRTPLEAAILALPRRGYGSMSPIERQQWVGETLARFRAMQAADDARRPPPVAAPASARRAPAPSPARAAASPADAAGERSATETGGGLASPITVLRSIRKPTADKFAKLGVKTIEGLLRLYPTRHIDFSIVRPINELRDGIDQTVKGSVFSVKETQLGRRMRGAEMVLSDHTGTVRAIWFNQPWMARQFRSGQTVTLAGRPTVHRGHLVFESPEYETEGEEGSVHTGRLVPVYPLTAGLAARSVRRATSEALERFGGHFRETLPEDVRQHAQLLPAVKALRQIHYPDSAEAFEAARRRFAFEELFEIQVAVLMRRKQWRAGPSAPVLSLPDEVRQGWAGALPFPLTGAQQRSIGQVLDDLKRSAPMARLLQGDVGSGKTVVAATGLIAAVASGYQGAIMAPTELLAEQHFRTLCRLFTGEDDPVFGGRTTPEWFGGRPLRVELLVGSMGAKAKREVQQEIERGAIDIAVGTHALIQEDVSFRQLGLAVVDEQHRFGVVQRSELRKKGASPHLLVMSATPIPRTLALTLYGELDVSVLDEMPPGRIPIKTVWAKPHERAEAYQFLRGQVEQGRQAFIICPLVEGADVLQVRSATEEFERLSREIYPDLTLDLVHGRMPAKEREAAMRRFRDGGSQVLVATSVIEVGIDIANAAVMMIEGADRFGLSQLHQFRGRVGRGAHASYCLLLSDEPSPDAETRMKLMEETNDGFKLAEEDLKLRGPGDYFGVRQSGEPELRAARLGDTPLLDLARGEAEALLERDAGLTAPELVGLKLKIAGLMTHAAESVH